MLEKIRRRRKSIMQDRTIVNTPQDLEQKYDLENNDINNYLDTVVDYINNNIGRNTSGGDNIPIGVITPYPSDTLPDNWLLCDGRAVGRTDYSELFAVLGTSHGAGDGSTTFNLPNIKGRVIAGKDGTTEFANIGTLYGAKTHTLTVGQLPAHGHTGTTSSVGDHNHAIAPAIDGGTDAGRKDRLTLNGWGDSRWWWNSAMSAGAGGHNHTVTVGNTGSGQAHNNIQPTISENYIIKAKYSEGVLPQTGQVIDNLDSTSKVNALSAGMGKVLKELLDIQSLKGKSIILRKNTTQLIASQSLTEISYQTIDAGYDSSIFTVSNNRIYINSNKVKLIKCSQCVQLTTNVNFILYVAKNGSILKALTQGSRDSGSIEAIIPVNQGDYISFLVWCSTATSLSSSSTWNLAEISVLDTI